MIKEVIENFEGYKTNPTFKVRKSMSKLKIFFFLEQYFQV